MQTKMMFSDTSRGRAFAKDPSVIRFGGRYLLYYSIGPYVEPLKTDQKLPVGKNGWENDGWCVGIAESEDLTHWKKVGEIAPANGNTLDSKGIAAPCAVVVGGRVELFYQSYGNGALDAICRSESTDGIHFKRDPSNPVFRPHGAWTNGRAIDADVFVDQGRAYLQFATRDPSGKIQKLGVATCSVERGFSAGSWVQALNGASLEPTLPWEQDCIEAPTVFKRGDSFFMFYAGAYNNAPQQIGLAVSRDGIHWRRASDRPFLAVGKPGSWNSSESGHPGVFVDQDGTVHLFYQGNDTHGKTWSISRVDLVWRDGLPALP